MLFPVELQTGGFKRFKDERIPTSNRMELETGKKGIDSHTQDSRKVQKEIREEEERCRTIPGNPVHHSLCRGMSSSGSRVSLTVWIRRKHSYPTLDGTESCQRMQPRWPDLNVSRWRKGTKGEQSGRLSGANCTEKLFFGASDRFHILNPTSTSRNSQLK
ncbi:hypothetical protein BT96DRAFT_1099218 [Gymnopus androsaceus JB14]|uniref:Uncharacterized protein n=1 Tax=Gymnopus androsaceus JB14 TaxID=1447944 RepID=A0A6A4HTP8_9AGAR|nr:hypothetical protein BT96DRAFT_1099218 [Gymnopus androsaceus JB14]